MVKVLVCGPREGIPYTFVQDSLDGLLGCAWIPSIDTIVTGRAKGVDLHVELWATNRGKNLVLYPANWGAHGRSAGPIRNAFMLRDSKPNIVVAFKPKSGWTPGTKNMKDLAEAEGYRVEVVEY